MANDIIPSQGPGGGVIVADPAGGDRGVITGADPARAAAIADPATALELTDAQHFESLGANLTAAFTERGIRDSQLAAKVVEVAQATYRALGDKEFEHSFALLGPFTSRLLSAGIDDPRTIEAAITTAADYLAELDDDGNAEQDEAHFLRARATLKQAWGANYRQTVAAIRDFVNNRLPLSLADVIWDGRNADGHRLANHAGVMLWLAGLAGVKGSGGIPMADLERERREIEALLGNHSSKYWKGPDAAKLQARYLELIGLMGGER